MIRLALTLWLLIACQVSAGWPDTRVIWMADGGSASFVDLDGKAFILSCAHRDIETSVQVGQRVSFVCGDDSRGVATVIAVMPHDQNSEPLRDCAIYSFVGGPSNAKTFRFSQRPLRRGEKVWVSGFPMSRGYSCRTTQVISDDGTLFLVGRSTPGESGGPIINSDGELVGTLTGEEGDGPTMATSRNIITRCCGRSVATTLCKQVLAQCGSCPNGQCGQQWAPPRRQQLRPVPMPTPPLVVLPPPQPPIAQQPPKPGPPGPAGPQGPPGPPGDGTTCECGPRWTEINLAIAALKADMQASQTAISELTLIVGDLDKRQCKPATITFIGDDDKIVATAVVTPGQTSAVTLPPTYFRVTDPRAGYSTEYQPARPGSYVTLPFGPEK